MASHLTVTTTSAGMTSSKGLNGSAGAPDGGRDVFAALLGSTSKPADAAPSTSAPSDDRGLNTPPEPAIDFGGAGAEQQDDPEAVAALLDATTPPPADLTTPLLSDIINGLADLQARLAAGEPLDAEALKRLDAALTQLSDLLGLDPAAMASLDDLAALATTLLPEDASFEARLTAALAPFAKTLLDGSASSDAALAAQTKAIGDKLATLLAALNSADQLTLEADAELNAALARLTAAPALDPADPALATPTLKLTEPTLTGKASTDASAAPAAGGDTTKTPDTTIKAQTAGNAEARSDDRKPADTRPMALAAAIDTPDAPSAAQPGQAARVDLVGAPRVVQAGYQTSQQQLNLPQLAFELVRQVNDGNARFQIRLDPPELGRIHVRLDIDASGQVNARLTVEKAETLDLMQRDQRGLEKALQQAGLDSAKTNLEFSLKQNPFSGGQQGGDGRSSLFRGELAAEAEEAPPPIVNLYRGSLSASGVNILA